MCDWYRVVIILSYLFIIKSHLEGDTYLFQLFI